MAIPISMLPSDLVYNGGLDVSNPVKQAKYDALNRSYDQSNGGGGGSSSGGGGYQQISPADYQNLENQVYFGTNGKPGLKAYYMRLVSEAAGDMNKAIQTLNEDYQRGVRNANQDYGINADYTKANLNDTLAQLGVQFQQEQEGSIDKLNQRGMATTQQNPDGTYNSLRVATPTTTPGDTAITSANQVGTSSLNGGANPAVGGRGATELGRVQQDQLLRQTALQRAANKNLQGYGIDLTRATNPNTTDRSQMGTLELAKIRGTDTATRENQRTGEDLNNQMQQQVLSQTDSLARAGLKENTNSLNNYSILKDQTNFTNNGVT